MPPSPVLPLATFSLRAVIVLNWMLGAAILALLTATLVAERWTFTALGIGPNSWIPSVIWGLRAVAALGLVATVLNALVLRRLLAMVDTVRHGDPFVADNANRLQAIAWTLLALGALAAMIIGPDLGIGKAISTPAHPLHLGAGFSTAGWLAVLLTFILARVFAAGAVMREELAGTV